jgi:serine/threonine kinase 16
MDLLSDLTYALASCLTCFESPVLRINRYRFHITKLLGEGGFSYVYLVQADDGQEYALKKIRCPFGPESVQVAMREVESYKLFDSEYVIRLVDSSVVQEKDGSRTVYMVLPYFRQGNLQDAINEHLMNGTHFEEAQLVDLFIEICNAVRVLHKNHKAGPSLTNANNDEDDEDVALLEGEDEYTDTQMSEMVPYWHGDIKPANIMLNNMGTPVLMDLGSCAPARRTLATRKDALELQDMAAEHCTMPYRAPELFDVKTGSKVDERIDIWSLGCTFFTLMYSSSPFELQTAESGASLNMAVMNGQFKFPAFPEYSHALKNVVQTCLTVDPEQRPFIDDVLHQLQQL